MALTDGCIAYWNLNDDGSGGVSLVDSTGNGNTLANNGATLDPNGIIDQAASIPAGGQLLSSTTLVGSFPLSYSSWVQSASVGETGAWSGISTGYPGQFRTLAIDGDIFFQAPDTVTANTTGGSYNDGAWHYVVGVADGTNIYLYVDGSLVSTVANSSNASDAVLFIGGEPGQGYGDSNIDEVGIWNRALSPTDVISLYNGGAGLTYPFDPALLSLYYNNAQEDGDWGNILNWWQDSRFTVQATALPTATNPINLYNQVTQNTQGADQCFCASASFWSADFGVGLTLQASGVVNMQGTSILAGTTTDGVSMHDSSQLAATSVVDGNVTMRDSSRAFGSILGNATIYYDGGNGQFPIGGTVAGSVTYLGWPAVSPQWFNDLISVGGAGDGDWNNQLNWWTNNSYTTRPINAEGTQELPDASTDVFIGNGVNDGISVRQNTGTPNPTVNSITANFGGIGDVSFAPMSFTITNGMVLNNTSIIVDLTIYGNVTFNTGSHVYNSVINGNATYTSAASLQYTWTASANSLGNLNEGATYGSTGFFVNISGGGTALGTNWISRLLHLPWFINV